MKSWTFPIRLWKLLALSFGLTLCLCKADSATPCKSVEEVVQILNDSDWVPEKLELLVTVHGTIYHGPFSKTEEIDMVSTVSIFDGVTYWNASDLEGSLKKKKRVILTPDIAYHIKSDNSYTTSPITRTLLGMYLNPLLYLNQMLDNMSHWEEDLTTLADFISVEAEINDVHTSCIGAGKIHVNASYESTSATLRGDLIMVKNSWEAIVGRDIAGYVSSFSRQMKFSSVERIFENVVREESAYKGFNYPSLITQKDWEGLSGKTQNELNGTIKIQVLKTGDEVAPIDIAAILGGLS